MDMANGKPSSGGRWQRALALWAVVLGLLLLLYLAAVCIGVLGIDIHFSHTSWDYIAPVVLVLLLAGTMVAVKSKDPRER